MERWGMLELAFEGNTNGNPYELNGRIESDVSGGVEIWVFAYVEDIYYSDRYYILSDYGNGSTWATASVSVDDSMYNPYQASADFVANGVWQTYDYPGGWNWG